MRRVPARLLRAAGQVLAWGGAVALAAYLAWFPETALGFLWLLYGPT